MKSLVKSLLIGASIGLFSTSVSAATTVVRDTIVNDTTVQKENPQKGISLAEDEVTYSKIETSAIPEVVSAAVTKKYEGRSVEEAYKGSDNGYKLILAKEGTKLTVYFDENGEFIKEEACPAEKE